MQLQIDKTPMTRGVTHLMYVGDDQAVERAVYSGETAMKVMLAAGAAGVLYAILGSGKHRALAGGVGGVLLALVTAAGV